MPKTSQRRPIRFSLLSTLLAIVVISLWFAWHADASKRDREKSELRVFLDQRNRAQKELNVFSQLQNAGVPDAGDVVKDVKSRIAQIDESIASIATRIAEN